MKKFDAYDEKEIIRLAQNGDQDAIDFLFSKYMIVVKKVARRFFLYWSRS